MSVRGLKNEKPSEPRGLRPESPKWRTSSQLFRRLIDQGATRAAFGRMSRALFSCAGESIGGQREYPITAYRSRALLGRSSQADGRQAFDSDLLLVRGRSKSQGRSSTVLKP